MSNLALRGKHIAKLIPRAPLRHGSFVPLRPLPLFASQVFAAGRVGCRRSYAQGPPGGGGKGGFPGFSMGPQHQKGEALKEYVSALFLKACLDHSGLWRATI
ncbi:hypothetical protein PLICRDRAFT_44563 [Plicaturopsis crispa FD-325 SS-3]|nr:hypothetical protein PLICRDRAFT_44563 [Plicaturopsis crispa FD-325 SS-3]